MAINHPYTPETFEDFLANTGGDYHQEWMNYKVGGSVRIDPNCKCHFKDDLAKIGYPADVKMTIDTLLVGDMATFDDDMCLVDKSIQCLLNCKLPNGEILSANSHFFEVVDSQE